VSPIPVEAMRVVEMLRRDVPRPKCPPEMDDGDGCVALRCLRWQIKGRWYCPIGLHPKAGFRSPIANEHWPVAYLSHEEYLDFIHWWDALDEADAQDAMDAIWPPERQTAQAGVQ
jgi:hypothetical protein